MTNPNGPVTGRPSTYATRGMVATSHYLASGAGLRALRDGGSAVDAIIAANAVLCVAYPHMAGLGGDGFWLIHDPRDKKVHALNASGPAAKAATRDYYAERGHTEEIPARGGLAALSVPGAVDGWRALHERFGRLDWDRLFIEAIDYAEHGVPVSRSLADWLVEDVPVLSEHSAGSVYLPNGSPMREGERLTQANLAKSFREIATKGARVGLYEGSLAERICGALEREDSPLRADDFAAFQAEWVDPITTTYRDYTAYGFPPNTQGFAALILLNIMEGYDLTAWGDGSADFYHYFAEAVKLAFADRDAWLTDPKFLDIPLDKLLAKSYANDRRDLIDAATSHQMGEIAPGIAVDRKATSRVAAGDTCAFSAVDENGLVVSAIQSIYHDFGSAVVAGDTGVLLQNRGSFMSLDPDHVNTLEPGKRTFHTLIPAMLLRDGQPYLAYGAMGGEGQPQTQAALVTRMVDFGYGVQQAIEAPRWLMGRTWGTESRFLSLEGRISDEVIRELTRRGQPVQVLPDWDDNMGHAQAIRIDREHGFLEGGADPRGDGAALGY